MNPKPASTFAPKPATDVEAKNRMAAIVEYAWAKAEHYRPELAGEPKNDNADEDLYTYWVDRLQKAAALVMPYPSATYRALAMVDEGAAGAPRRINPDPQGRLVELMLGAI
jgi:hypothetical protein